jgi:hypothetical protein
LDFGDPLAPTPAQKALGLDPEETNFAILRGSQHTLVHFNAGLPPLLFDHNAEGELRDIACDPGASGILLAMTRAMLDHRMSYANGRFIRTMITQDGAVTIPRQT